MPVKKIKILALTSAERSFVVSLIGLFLLSCVLFYSQYVIAETNVSGIEIETIDEPVSSSLPGDQVQDFLTDVDAKDNSQDDLWARIKDGYAMPDIESEYTATHEEWYASRPDYVKRMVERSQKYLFHVVEEVQKRGMPTEIALLPMIESAFNPQANSRSHASGIWQFVPSTGKTFGLKQNWWVDNRRDVTAATDAALDYLQKLYGMFEIGRAHV
jgi:membrane-bound lytic murein transglycosylase D